MARRKAEDKTTDIKQPVSFRCPANLKESLDDLARLSRSDVSTILIELCSELVKANKDRITKFRQSASQPLKKPTFAAPSKKKDAAPMTADTNTATKGDDSNGEE